MKFILQKMFFFTIILPVVAFRSWRVENGRRNRVFAAVRNTQTFGDVIWKKKLKQFNKYGNQASITLIEHKTIKAFQKQTLLLSNNCSKKKQLSNLRASDTWKCENKCLSAFLLEPATFVSQQTHFLFERQRRPHYVKHLREF